MTDRTPPNSPDRPPWINVISVYLLITGAVGVLQCVASELSVYKEQDSFPLVRWFTSVSSGAESWYRLLHYPIQTLTPVMMLILSAAIRYLPWPRSRQGLWVAALILIPEPLERIIRLFFNFVLLAPRNSPMSYRTVGIGFIISECSLIAIAAFVLFGLWKWGIERARASRLIAWYLIFWSALHLIGSGIRTGLILSMTSGSTLDIILNSHSLLWMAGGAGSYLVLAIELACGVVLLCRERSLGVVAWILLVSGLLDVATIIYWCVSRSSGSSISFEFFVSYFARPLGMIALWIALIRFSRRPPQAWSSTPLCMECGYNLTGNASGVCPECGCLVPATT